MGSTPAQALVAPAGHAMVRSMGQAILASQMNQGCESTLWPEPVALEPPYQPVMTRGGIDIVDVTYEAPPPADAIVRHQIWISPEYALQWDRCELLLRHLPSVSHRMALEIIGNAKQMMMNVVCHRADVPILSTAFEGRLRECKLSLLEENRMTASTSELWDSIRLCDYYPFPPYHHLLTGPDQLHSSPYECLAAALTTIPKPAFGIYQVIFQPVERDNNWHGNVKALMDIEYAVKLAANPVLSPRFLQQLPSGALSHMAGDTETKAHNDKPFYTVAVRTAVVGAEDAPEPFIKSLNAFVSLFQHGGRPLNHLTEADYHRILSNQQIRQMFEELLVYRPGFLLNSAELAGFAHVPPADIFDLREVSFDTLEPLASDTVKLSQGTPIGQCHIAGQFNRICIPAKTRSCHTHLIGRPHMGKSTLEEHMILHDIKQGHGVAVLDPHGDMAERLLTLIPKEAIDRVIYFDPADPNWVPIWNPMQRIVGQDIGRTTDDLVGVLKSFVTGWGDRMEHLLRHGIFGLMHINGTSLQDLSDLLRGSKEGQTHRKLILDVIENEAARQFWQHDFMNYGANEFGPPKHKLSKLLVGGTVSLMLSQPNSFFNFRTIMDEGMIFVGNLAGLGTEVREILGGFLVAVMHMTALSRSDQDRDTRKAFHIYLDEAHRFVTDSLEDIIAETRKYNVSLTLAHQYLRQFDSKKIDALSSVGTTVVFNVDSADASSLAKGFKKKVKVEDFIDLDVGQAIIRCGNEIVKIDTPKPKDAPDQNYRNEIIEYSRQHYCKSACEVHQLIAQRGQRVYQPFSSLKAVLDKFDKKQHTGKFTHDRVGTDNMCQ